MAALCREQPSKSNMTRPPESGPVTMRVQKPTMGERRALEIGQKTLTGADRPKAPTGRGQARLRQLGSRGCQGPRYQRAYLPPLEKALWRDEFLGGQAPQGVGERECSPQEAACRKRVGHRSPKGGEPGKLLSLARRRQAVEHLQQRFEVSECRACRAVGQPRSSQRYVSTKVGKDAALVKRMVALSTENPRYGYRRVWALLRREGWEVNKKRVHRLWREADLKVPAGRRRKRQRLGSSENGVARRQAEHLDHLWSYDFA